MDIILDNGFPVIRSFTPGFFLLVDWFTLIRQKVDFGHLVVWIVYFPVMVTIASENQDGIRLFIKKITLILNFTLFSLL